MTTRNTPGLTRRLWWTGRGRARHENRLRAIAAREELAQPGGGSGGRYGENQITGVAATAPPLLVGGRRRELAAGVERLVDAAAAVRAADAAERTAEEDLRRLDRTASEPPVPAGPRLVAGADPTELVEPADPDAPAPGSTGTDADGPSVTDRSGAFDEVVDDEPLHPDDVLAAQRSLPRRVQARTVECVMVLFDWFFYTQTYLQVSGQPAGWANADQMLTFFGAVLLGLVGPPIVLVSARIIAKQAARMRDGLLEDPARERANWIAVQVAVTVLVVLTVVFYMVMRLRLQLAAGLGNELPPNVWVLQLLVALLPVAVVLSDYWAADPKADAAAKRVRLRARSRADRAKVPTAADLVRDARDRAGAAAVAVERAAAEQERSWFRTYELATRLVSDAWYFEQLADNLIADVRAFVATERGRQPAPERTTGAAVTPLPVTPATNRLPAGEWRALDAALVALVRYAPAGLQETAEALRASLLPPEPEPEPRSERRDSA